MSDFGGYRVIIGQTAIENNMIAKGSYSFVKNKRVIGEWTDGNGITHQDVYPTRKVTISFSIRERNLADHESIAGIFEEQERVNVVYYDDFECVYKEGTFRITPPTIQHINVFGSDIEYAATQITLEEF